MKNLSNTIFNYKMNQLFFGLILLFQPSISISQIPKKAVEIADSICQTRLLCPNTKIKLTNSIFYPKEFTKYQNRKTETYFFQFIVQVKEDIITDLNIYINEDFTIIYISGLPDNNYSFKPCQIMSRYELWQIAKSNGLRTKFRKCRYFLYFEEDGIFIKFQERKSRWNTDLYKLNALSGEFLHHMQGNVNF